jgi:TonB-dependent receptor
VGFRTIALATSPTGVSAERRELERSYDNWLPSVNLVADFTPELLGRLSVARVMSRPDLGPLINSSPSITATTRNGTATNPLLDPIVADTFDAALEWYFRPGSLFSVAYFRKNIETFIQTAPNSIPFNQLGLPDALLTGTNSSPNDVFTIRQPLNTPGGVLKGFEVNFQTPFRFLPGFLSNFGVLASYVHVTSKIDYIVPGSNPPTFFTADLVGLSKDGASGTLYYEDSRFSIRSTANYRSPFIRGIIAANGSDYQGNAETLFVDASASYNITDNLRLILEATNLTDERNTLFIDGTRQDTLFETRIGRTFNFGVNAKF